MVILGMNAYHGDSSACIVVDGKLIAAAGKWRLQERLCDIIPIWK